MVVSPYFASLGSYNSECLALGLNKEHQASLTDRHQFIRSSWAALEAATVLGSSKLFPARRQKLKPCPEWAFQLPMCYKDMF